MPEITENELNDLFALANDELKETEAFGSDIAIPALNELRHGSEHRVLAQGAESEDIRNSELLKAKTHFIRAAHDALQSRIFLSLEQLSKFKQDFSKFAEKEDIPSFLDALNTANELKVYLINRSQQNEFSDFGELKEKAHHLDEQLAKLSANRNLLINSIEKSKKSTLHWVYTSLLGVVLSLLAATFPLFFQGEASKDISQQIESLSGVQNSLSKLQHYVSDQKNILHTLNKDISNLKIQKTELEQVVSIENKKIEAVLKQYENSQQQKRWLDIVISFLVGIFSSLTVTFILSYRRKSKESPSVDMIVNTKGKSI